ncbi:hypothetical protein L7F22_021964 [Adiantum nelumboides]|nr:hypothetical protein [Adiantum nelumboides]
MMWTKAGPARDGTIRGSAMGAVGGRSASKGGASMGGRAKERKSVFAGTGQRDARDLDRRGLVGCRVERRGELSFELAGVAARGSLMKSMWIPSFGVDSTQYVC